MIFLWIIVIVGYVIPTIVFMDFIRASILYGRECDDRLTLGPVIIASLISIIPIMNVFVACNAYGDLSRQEREGMTKYSLFCKLFCMEL